MKCLPAIGLSIVLTLVASGCASVSDDESQGTSNDALSVTASFVSRGTGYYPSSSALEGGFVDRKGVRLRTLQQFLAGQAEYVSVAMDSSAFSYGQHLRIKELDAKYGRAIDFRVVDTGGAFRGRGRSRIDICVANQKASVDPTINGSLHIDAVTGFSGSASPPAAPPPPASPPPAAGGDPPAPPATPPAGGSSACTTDGQCNPGNDGSGLICTGGACVPGCRTNAQCPGSSRCTSGQCR
jgi:hypothetical protein